MSDETLLLCALVIALAVTLWLIILESYRTRRCRFYRMDWFKNYNTLCAKKDEYLARCSSLKKELDESEAINRRYEDRFNEQDATIKAQELLIQDKDRELNERDAGGPHGVAMIESLRSVVLHKCELLELAGKCLATAMSTINAQVDLLAEHGVKIPKISSGIADPDNYREHDDYAEAEAQRAQSMVS